MLLIKKTSKKETKNIKLIFDAELLARVEKYCSFGGIEINDFFAQAAEYIFRKDKEFKKFEAEQSKK